MKVPIYDLKLNKNNLPYLCKVGEVIGSKRIDSTKKAVVIFNKAFDAENLAEETCMLLCLNNNSEPIGVFKISKGTYRGCLIGIRGIIHRCLDINANYFIVAHNHPSGSLKPSEADISRSNELKTLGFMFEMPLQDSIIITKNDYVSIDKDESDAMTIYTLIHSILAMGNGEDCEEDCEDD